MSVIAAKKFSFVFQTQVRSLFLFMKHQEALPGNKHIWDGGMQEQQVHTKNSKKAWVNISVLLLPTVLQTLCIARTQTYITHGSLNSGKTLDRQAGCYSKGLSLITGLAVWASCTLVFSVVPCVRQVHLHAIPLATAVARGGKDGKALTLGKKHEKRVPVLLFTEAHM